MKKLAAIGMLSLIAFTAFAGGSPEIDDEGWRTFDGLDGYEGVELRLEAAVSLIPGNDWKVMARGDEGELEDLEIFISRRRLVMRRDSLVDLRPNRQLLEIEVTLPVLTSVVNRSSGTIEGEDPFECRGLKIVQEGSGSVALEALADSLDIVSSGSGAVEFSGRADRVKLKNTGSADISLDIKTNRIDAVSTGSGGIEMEGAADLMEIHVSGSGDVEASEMVVRDAEVSMDGSGNASLKVQRRLSAAIRGSGDLVHIGMPEELDVAASGSGRVQAASE